MKKYLVNFATPNFYWSQKRLNESGLKYGIDEVRSYNKEMIKKTSLYKKNKWILDQKRGGGYWLWKPYIILDTMEKINEGDVIFYSDSAIEIVNNLDVLIPLCKSQKGILLFGIDNINKIWTKKDCFVLMECDSEKYWNAKQVHASFQVYMKNKKSVKFLKEYLYYCKNKNIISDLPNICGKENLPGFKENRHDQSVLTNLAVKYNIHLFRDPSQGGNSKKMEEYRVPNEWLRYPYTYEETPDRSSPYPTIINHHRQIRASAKMYHAINVKLPRPFRIVIKKIVDLIHEDYRDKIVRNKKN